MIQSWLCTCPLSGGWILCNLKLKFVQIRKQMLLTSVSALCWYSCFAAPQTWRLLRGDWPSMCLVCSRLQVVGAVSQSSLSGQIFIESDSSSLKPGLCVWAKICTCFPSVHNMLINKDWNEAYCALHCLVLINELCFFFAVILIVVSVCTATGAWNWLIDPDTQKVCKS